MNSPYTFSFLKKININAYWIIVFLLLPNFVFSQLSGTYTIDGTGNGNYQTISDAVKDLNTKGINGNVTFNILKGVYKEQVIIDTIPGASASNSVIFQSQSGDTGDVVIYKKGHPNVDSESVIWMLHADYVTFKNLTITGNSFGAFPFYIQSGCTNITIENCHIKTDLEDGIFFSPIVAFSEFYNGIKNITIRNNMIEVNSRGIVVSGSYFVPTDNVVIDGNIFKNVNDGVQATVFRKLVIRNNIFLGDNGDNGLEISNGNKSRIIIEKNRFEDFSDGMFFGLLDLDPNFESYVANNFIQARNQGISNSSLTIGKIKAHFKFYYNSINVNGSSSSAAVTFCNKCDFKNNIFANSSGGPVVVYDDQLTDSFTSNYNDFYTTANFFGLKSTLLDTIKTFSDFQNLSGTDDKSLNNDPQYKSGTDLHITSASISDKGIPLSLVTDDIDGEPRDQFTPDIGADEITAVANLKPQTITFSPQTAFSGSAIQVNYEVKDAGALTVYGPWNDAIYLSKDKKLDTTDSLVGDFRINLDLSANKSYNKKATVSLPTRVNGSFYLLVKTDVNGKAFENEDDNVLASANKITVKLAPKPDLAVTSVVAPKVSFSSKRFVLKWTVKNKGREATERGWSDYIYAARDSSLLVDPKKFNPDSLFITKIVAPVGLDTGETYTSQANVYIKPVYSGTIYYKVVADGSNSIMEEVEGHIDNGAVSHKMTVQQSPFPDLKLTSFNLQNTGFSGDYVPFSYTIKNIGTAPTIQDIWSDRIIFTRDSVIDRVTTKLITKYSKTHYGNLDPDSSYTVVDSFRLRDCLFDTFYVFFSVDRFNSTFELLEDNNFTRRGKFEVVLTPKPDLKPVSFNINSNSPASGKLVDIDYEVKNDGFVDIDRYKSPWFDRIYISKEPTFIYDSAINIGYAVGDTDLAKGDSYQRADLYTIPDSVFGDNYFYLVADDGDDVCEAPNEDNNVMRSSLVNIKLTPPPDLQVVSLNGQNNPYAGDLIHVNYEVENKGTGATNGMKWQDKVYLQKQGEKLSDATVLFTNDHMGALPVNQKYQFDKKLLIPVRLKAGTYRIAVETDVKDDIFEHNDEDNNVTYTSYFTLQNDPSRVSDLNIESFSYTGQVSSGRTLTLNYEVKNLSKKTHYGSWYDRLYLFSDNGKLVKNEKLYHFGVLDKSHSYTKQVKFKLPHGRSGKYKLVLKIDTTNRIIEYDLSNNMKKIALNISLSAPPDLQASIIQQPDTARSGQELTVKWLTKNKGNGQAFDTPWVDKVYISKDTFLDKTDYFLTREKIGMILNSGNSYQRSVTERLPLYLSGDYYVLVYTDAGEDLYEYDKEDNNIGYSFQTIHIFRPPLADLIKGGQGVSFDKQSRDLKYSIKNNGPNPAKGSWIDILYLSKDKIWSKDDYKYDTFRVSKNLKPGDSYDKYSYVSTPYITPGYYFLILKADAFNYIPETDLLNNTLVTKDSFYFDPTRKIVMDSLYRDTFSRFNRTAYYRLERPKETGMVYKLRMDNKNATTEVYQKVGDIPDRNNYDHKYDHPHFPDQILLIESERNDVTDYFYNYLAYRPNNFPFGYNFIAQSAYFSVYNMIPKEGGNYGLIAARISGFDFEDGMSFELRKGQDTIKPLFVHVRNATQATAHFDLRDHDTGSYDVIAIKNGVEKKLNDGFRVVQGGFPHPVVKVIQPSLVRPLNKFDIQISYGNEGLVNSYDNILIVAFFSNNFNPKDFSLHYLGSSEDRYYSDPSKNPNPPNDSNIVEVEGIKFFMLHVPILPASGQSDLTFRLKSKFEGTIYAYSFIFAQPLSSFSFTGKLDDAESMVTYREVAATFDKHLGQLKGSGKKINCDDFNYDNIKKDLVDQTIAVGESVDPKQILGEEGKNLFQKAKNHFISSVKESAKDQGKEAMKNYLLKDKGVVESVKDWYDGVENDVLPYKDPPFKDLLQTVDKCIDNNVSQKDIHDCLKEHTQYKNTKFERKVLINTCDGGGGGDGGGGTTSERPKDPNEIIGPDGITDMHFIKKGDRLIYTIYFENKPDAGVPAQNVTIENPLQQDFSLQDFELLSYGFGDTIINLPHTSSVDKTIELGQKYDNNDLKLVAGLNVISNRAFFRFSTIDPKTSGSPQDPMSGFLPPNDSTGIGEGFVKYQIKIKDNTPAGEKIENQADIVFDDNDEIPTNVWTNFIASPNPSSYVNTLPDTVKSKNFIVSWTGIEGQPVGMGIDAYDVYYAKDSSSYQLWQRKTAATEAEFTGEYGSTYRFFSRAVAEDGTKEDRPATYDAKTTIGDTTMTVGIKPQMIQNKTGELSMHIFPNPSHGKTNIWVNLPENGMLNITVFDVLGKKVKTIVNEERDQGNYLFNFNRNQLDGRDIYLIQVKFGNNLITRKMMMLR